MRRSLRWAGVVAALAVGAWSGVAAAQTATTLELERADARLTIVNRGRADEGARSVLNLPGCLEDEAMLSSLFYAPEAEVTTRILQEGSEDPTVVLAPLVLVTRPPGEAGRDQETLEALDAAATFGRPPCLDELEPAQPPRVRLEQGRTTVVGERFFLDREADVATMDGPVALTRRGEGESPEMDADADAMRFDLDTDRATLTGGVEVRAEDRVSSADELELDESAGVAVLRGEPARSRRGEDEVEGAVLIYDLETNDVVVEGGVSGTFRLDGR